MSLLRRQRVETRCRVEVEQSDEHFHAHVELADGLTVNPGDRVLVHGEPIRVRFGESRVFERTATVERAGLLARAWTRLAGHFELSELYEVSFTSRRVA